MNTYESWNMESHSHALPLVTEASPAVCHWAFRAEALRCVAQVCWLYPSVSCNLAGRVMFNIAALWSIYCSNPHTALTQGCQAIVLTMTRLEVTHILSPRGRKRVLHKIQTYKKRFVKRNLDKRREQKVLIPHMAGQYAFYPPLTLTHG